jgi:hypothetical protein
VSVDSLLARFAADRDRFQREREEALERAYRMERERDMARLQVAHMAAQIAELKALVDELGLDLGSRGA